MKALQWLFLAAAGSTASVHAVPGRDMPDCPACVSLSDLVAHTHGISISAHGITSAIQYHNGTNVPTGSLAASPALLEQLQTWSASPHGLLCRDPWSSIRDRDNPRPPPPQRAFLVQFRDSLLSLWQPPGPNGSPEPRLSPASRLFCDIFTALREQAAALGDGMQHVGLSIPPYLDSTHALHVFDGARCAGLEVEELSFDAAAVAASQGVGLRFVPGAYGRRTETKVMALDLSGHGLVSIWDRAGRVMHLSSEGLGGRLVGPVGGAGAAVREVREWIDAWADELREGADFLFAEEEWGGVDRLYVIGPLAENEILQKAVARSKLSGVLQELSGVGNASTAVAQGVAALAKIRMESQDDWCIERGCEGVRREADRIAGN